MGGRKKRLGRIPKYMEKKRQATGVNKQGRPRKFWQETTNAPPLSIITLEDIKQNVSLPSSSWKMQCSATGEFISFIELHEQTTSTQSLCIKHTLTISSDLSWYLCVNGHKITKERCSELFGTSANEISIYEVSHILCKLSSLNICPGHPDVHFRKLADAKKGKFLSSSGAVQAFLDQNCTVQLNGATYSATVRSHKCQILVHGSVKCSSCVSYRPTLRSIYHRWHKQQLRSPPTVTSSSHTNERYLSTPQRKNKVSKMKSRMRASEKKVSYLAEKIKASVTNKEVEVDQSLHEALNKIMDNFDDGIRSKYAEGTFHRLFWVQQMQNSAKSPKQRRWHPMMIRWCLRMKMLSSSAYEALRGMITLPCGRTLQDYTHFVKAGIGVQPEVTKQLLKEVGMSTLKDHQKFIAVIFDEMKVKEGLVYDKNECKIVGFVNLGPLNNAFQCMLDETDNQKQSVAKQILVFMVRGVFTKLKFPYAQFPTCGVTGSSLFFLAWGVIRNLEVAGFKVISLTGDGASPNRRFFNLHYRASGLTRSDPVNKVRNPYSADERYIFFFSDVPHLMKTVRNCWSNSFGHSHKRALWIKGQHISWEHLRRIYNRRSTSGLSFLTKLRQEHMNLNSYSRMRVNLAVQVLSCSVADAMAHYRALHLDSDTRETERFIRMFDRFFDMMNTRCLEEGKKKIKPDLDPYRSAEDKRLKWLESDFLGYLQEWLISVNAREGEFTQAERNKMVLSHETLAGLIITVKSFTEVARFLLKIPGVKFLLSERFCQDPLEAFFGNQRAKGGRSDNPNVQQFCSSTVSLRVQGSAALAPIRGNCKRRTSTIDVNEAPLPKRRRQSKKQQ